MRFKEARDGDHLMTPFQCDLCHFENCKRRHPIPNNTQDEVALLCIRRANLDALWSRERSTVRSNRLQGKHWVSASESAGWSDLALPKRGPFPVEDSFGMQAAVNLLLRSRDVGINAKNIQYETMRKLRSFFPTLYTLPMEVTAIRSCQKMEAVGLSQSLRRIHHGSSAS